MSWLVGCVGRVQFECPTQKHVQFQRESLISRICDDEDNDDDEDDKDEDEEEEEEEEEENDDDDDDDDDVKQLM